MGDVIIRITGQDGVTQVFKKIGSEASAMGQTVDASAKKSASAFDELEKHATAVFTTIATTSVRGLQSLAAAGEQNAQAQRQLQQAIENTGHSWGEYSASIEKATSSAAQFGISDDKATNALQSLTEITGSATSALNLLQVSEDLAAAKHMDLVTASELVGKAYEGNTAMLARYGIVLKQGATGAEAVAELQAKFGGQAAANTTLLSKYSAEFENWEGAMGAAMGPLSGIITLLPGVSTGFQLATSAGGLVIDMFRAQKAAALEAAAALEVETAATAEAAAASEAATVAEAGIAGGLLGPAGIVVALGAAAAAFLLLRKNAQDYGAVADQVTASSNKMNETIANLSASGSPNAANLRAVSDLFDPIKTQSQGYAAYQQALNNFSKGIANPAVSQDQLKAYSDALNAGATAYGKMSQSAVLSGDQIDIVTKSIDDLFGHSSINADKAQADVKALFDQFNAGTITANQLTAGIEQLDATWFQYATTATTADAATNKLLDTLAKLQQAGKDAWTGVMDPLKDVPALLNHINTSMDPEAQNIQAWADDAYNRLVASINAHPNDAAANQVAELMYVRELQGLVDQLSASEEKNALAASMSSQAMADMNAVMDYGVQTLSAYQVHLEAMRGSLLAAADAAQHFGVAGQILSTGAQGSNATQTVVDALGNSLAAQSTGTQGIADAWSHVEPLAMRAALAIADVKRNTDAADAATQKYISDLGMLPTFADQMGAIGDKAAAAASSVNHATAALADMQRVIIDNTDSIAQSSDKLFQWADKLIGEQGVYSKLDDLVNAGKISGQSGVFGGNNDYANAQRAYNDIAKDNLRVQEATAVIQAKQAPILADLANKQADYLEKVEKMPAAEQLAALGFMDSAESAKAMQLQSMAAAAAMGQLGDQGEKSTAKIIQGAAEADPALAAMLQSMGLITMGADGTITVNFPTGQTVQDAINGLQTSINNLVAIEYLLSIGADTSDFWDHVNGLDGQHVGQVWIDANLAYSSVAPITGAGFLPYGRDGITAMANGGTAFDPLMPRFAGGGTMTLVGEAGPELVNLSRGDQVTNAAATRSRLGARRDSVVYQHFGNVNVVPDTGDMRAALTRSALLRESRG